MRQVFYISLTTFIIFYSFSSFVYSEKNNVCEPGKQDHFIEIASGENWNGEPLSRLQSEGKRKTKIAKRKKTYKRFSLFWDIFSRKPKFSLKGYDDYTHMSYMKHVVHTGGYRWFYKYAPIKQIGSGYMAPDPAIIVKFDIRQSDGAATNFRFIKKGKNNVQNNAIKKTFTNLKFRKPSSGYYYRNLRMLFEVFPPKTHKDGRIFIQGRVSVDGEVSTPEDRK